MRRSRTFDSRGKPSMIATQQLEHRLANPVTDDLLDDYLRWKATRPSRTSSPRTPAGADRQKVHAELDHHATYPKGVKISDQQMAALPLMITASTATGTTPSAPRMTTL
jgi:hypothetical protein